MRFIIPPIEYVGLVPKAVIRATQGLDKVIKAPYWSVGVKQ